MSKQRIEIEVDVPEGWESTGEFRPGVRCDDQPCLLGVIPIRRVEPKKESRWVNVYSPPTHGCLVGAWYVASTREQADGIAAVERLSVIRIDYENGHPVSVALESVEPQ